MCVHGLTGSPDELTPLADALSTRGHAVVTPILAGHGHDVAALAITRWRDWLSSADAALTGSVAGGRPPAMVAASAGGLLALRLAATRPRDVRALVLLATPTALSASVATQIRVRLMVPPSIRPQSWNVIAKSDGPNVSDPALAAGLRSLPAYPLETLGQLLDLMADVRPRLRDVTQPVLIVHGDLDAVVSRAQVDALASALTRVARVERVALPASAHLVGIDRDREFLQQRVAEFLDSV